MRVEFKTGTQLPLEVWQADHVRRIIRAALIEAPPLVDDVLVVTSVFRGGPGSYHGQGRAVDIRTGLAGTSLESLDYTHRTGAIDPQPNALLSEVAVYQEAFEWSRGIAERLGNEFDVVYGIEADHVDHIHCEADAKKEGRA